ncbi:hypothetical protein HXX76_000800 [Chlamydomonas incerta]|uniref:Uncharacterized protein n=1 Tax=Chlamydomonas incerta TaxID=51695 RepID=A0A835WF47_CHLIN|nr:hypothetical protein HXX76_000800 [Chlamydomonas incerta]|eukprot:KAG2446208.1 hypothetical protein HXX76_000800 [Chlamydomonas incerta]
MASPSKPQLALSDATESLATLGMTPVAVSPDNDKDQCSVEGGSSDHRFASALPWPPADAASYLPPAVLAACVPATFDDFCRRMAASVAAGRLPAVLLVSAAGWSHLRPQIDAILGAAASASSAPAGASNGSSSSGSSSHGSSSSTSPVDLLVVPLGEGFRQRAHAAYAALPRDGPTPRLARQFGLDVALASLAAGDSAARGGYMPRSVPALLVARTAASAGPIDVSSSGRSMSGSGSSMYGSLDEVEPARQQLMVMGGAMAGSSMDGHGSSNFGHGLHGHGHSGQGHGQGHPDHRQKGGRRRRGVTFDGPYPAWCMRQELFKHVHRHALVAAAAAAAAAAAQQELQAWQQLQAELQAHHQQQAAHHQQHELRYLTGMQGGRLLEMEMGSDKGSSGSGAQLSTARALRHT